MKNDIFEQIKVEVVKCAMALNDCADLKDVKSELWLSYYMAEDCTADGTQYRHSSLGR